MARPARVSPDAILAAAALEFAARGFAGARVDRIARRARVNKAMLYYHFTSKERLYRTLLRRMFTRAAERLRAIGAGDGTSAEKVDFLSPWTLEEWLCRSDIVPNRELLMVRANMEPGRSHPFHTHQLYDLAVRLPPCGV